MIEEHFSTLGLASGGAVVFYILTHLIRKAWQNVTEAALDTQKEAAESSVVSLMRSELIRLAADLTNLKDEYHGDLVTLKVEAATERNMLVQRIRDLEQRVEKMTQKFSSIRLIAMDIYHLVSSMDAPQEQRDAVREHLSKIINENSDDDPSI